MAKKYIIEINKNRDGNYEIQKTILNFSVFEALEVFEAIAGDLKRKASGTVDPKTLNEQDFIIKIPSPPPCLNRLVIMKKYRHWVDTICDDLPDKSTFTIEEIVNKICSIAEEQIQSLK
jgi:hypothetical protein